MHPQHWIKNSIIHFVLIIYKHSTIKSWKWKISTSDLLCQVFTLLPLLFLFLDILWIWPWISPWIRPYQIHLTISPSINKILPLAVLVFNACPIFVICTVPIIFPFNILENSCSFWCACVWFVLSYCLFTYNLEWYKPYVKLILCQVMECAFLR